MKHLLIIFIGMLLFFGEIANLHAAVYFVDNAASNDNGNGSIDNPKKYITSGLRLMKGGDTLILKDGVYTGGNNMIGDYASPQTYPPSGLGPSQYTVIKAEHVGRVIIDAEYQRFAFSNYNTSKINYLRVEGIHFRHGLSGLFNLMGDYNKVIRCGFEDGMPPNANTESPIAMIAGGSSYSLVEDSWVWGRGRYGFYTNSTDGGTNHIIFRRLVVRLDSTPENFVCAGTRFYHADTNVAQNVVVLDSKAANCESEGAFSMGGGSSVAEPNHTYEGIIALNNDLWSGFFPDYARQITSIDNAIFWGNGRQGLTTVSTGDGTIVANHITSGKNALNGFRSNTSYNISVDVRNSIDYGNAENSFDAIDSIDTVNVFGNGNNSCVSCTINNEITSNPFAVASSFSNPALKYLVRIENNSNLHNASTDGGDIGSNVLYKIGKSESLYGEAGWNEKTAEKLWPWPDENIWLPKMSAYNASGPGGNRGFAANGQTLTNYVWGYFSYDNDPETVASTVPPFNVTTSPNDGRVTITWDIPASISASTITHYRVYNVTGISNPVVPGTLKPVAEVSGSTYTTTISGLVNGNSYDFVVTAVDSNKGESSYSYKVTEVPRIVKTPKSPTNVYTN